MLVRTWYQTPSVSWARKAPMIGLLSHMASERPSGCGRLRAPARLVKCLRRPWPTGSPTRLWQRIPTEPIHLMTAKSLCRLGRTFCCLAHGLSRTSHICFLDCLGDGLVPGSSSSGCNCDSVAVRTNRHLQTCHVASLSPRPSTARSAFAARIVCVRPPGAGMRIPLGIPHFIAVGRIRQIDAVA